MKKRAISTALVALLVLGACVGCQYDEDAYLDIDSALQVSEDSLVVSEASTESSKAGYSKEEIRIDYDDAVSFEKALNNGVDVSGKIVRFDVLEYKPNSALGINCWSGEHLNFISKTELEVKKGDVIVGRVCDKVSKELGSWRIPYEVLSIETSSKEENGKYENSSQIEVSKQENSRTENSKEESSKSENSRIEVSKQESSRIETSKSGNIGMTISKSNAIKKAKSYLEYTAFSRDGLIKQLEYEKYSHDDAVYAVDNCGADWNEQAVKKAKSYLEYTAFSRDGLIEQLEYEGFTNTQAKYGADRCGADWNEQAVKKAKSYLEYTAFSRDGLIEQLEYEGFTNEQATYGASANGL